MPQWLYLLQQIRGWLVAIDIYFIISEYLFYNNPDAVQVRGTAGYTDVSWDDMGRRKDAELMFYQNAVLDTARDSRSYQYTRYQISITCRWAKFRSRVMKGQNPENSGTDAIARDTMILWYRVVGYSYSNSYSHFVLQLLATATASIGHASHSPRW